MLSLGPALTPQASITNTELEILSLQSEVERQLLAALKRLDPAYDDKAQIRTIKDLSAIPSKQQSGKGEASAGKGKQVPPHRFTAHFH